MTLLDAGKLPEGASLTADIAVVGAGPAGIVIGLTLADAGHRVLLVESGGARFDAETQHLGSTVGGDPFHAPMELATRREVGGASNIWGGRCVPFDPVDFETRELTAGAEWPVDYEELASYFQPACDWCVCGDAVFDARRIPALAKRAIVPGFVDVGVGASSLERWSLPTNFRRQYGERLKRSKDLTLVTGLTCSEIVCGGSGGAVDHLEARTLAGGSATVRAAKYVIACGGLEATRLLFASDATHPDGLGNHSGHLGRWYMAHVEARVAQVHFSTPPSQTIYGHERDSDGVYVRRRFTLSPELQRDRGLANAAIWLVNPKLSDPSHGSGVLSFVYLILISPLGRLFVAEAIRRAHVDSTAPVSVRRHLGNLLRHPFSTVRFAISFGYRRFLRRGRKVPGFFVPSAANVYPLMYHGEHLPHYESQVKPSAEVDELGMPRLETHLHFSEEDIAGVRAALSCLDEVLREQRLGRVELLHDEVDVVVRKELAGLGGYHQAGTTRMSERPEDGVVDGQLAVHGFDDLFIASSSTFPTSSQANSTFTLIAFALRLADHLNRELSPRTERVLAEAR